MSPHLPDKDFDLSNLSRHQAAVFEHVCLLARHGLGREIGAHEVALDLPNASQSVLDEHRVMLRQARAAEDRIIALHHRLTRLRTAKLTAEEQARLAAARQAKPDLSFTEADLVVYGLLEPLGPMLVAA